MQKEQVKILNEFAKKVRNVYPKALICAFGSYIRGTETAESDLDICVVLPEMRPDDRSTISDLAWEVGFNYDLHLSTVVFSKKDFEQGPVSASPLIEAIRSEGLAV
jgi:predicted nucleotidyltransferase